jgi:hypothetical protein
MRIDIKKFSLVLFMVDPYLETGDFEIFNLLIGWFNIYLCIAKKNIDDKKYSGVDFSIHTSKHNFLISIS